MGGDRLGMRWGLAGGTTIASVAEARRVARYADAAGFDGLWISHATAVDPVVALACVADDIANLAEVGTSVVPLYGRHPIGLAQLARTAQSALGGRFTLGIGAASRGAVATTMGLGWEHPLAFTREFIDGLQPLLAGRPVDLDGAQLSAHVALTIDAPATPILLAALGPRMLELAGRRVHGTSVGQCGPRTIATHIAPAIRAAAAAAGRPDPRIMALVRICVTDEPAPAYELARATASRYRQVPSYAAVQDREGLADPAELHLIGSWERVLDGLAAYGAAGATDLRLEVAAPDEASREATREALAAHLG
ncbi:TIGR03564 family F420-dependent LLM class oxidoreductase [Pseudonocardia humida]|uniref:TIGR03564 family F420-dependent LLM class oxidoreductase n=1 Tax=Pseudonocardia humida TaxID=2800819 RepID=A0ABT0ZZG8_9PSEU|nr:TIGR03564 family F420-dependent LLM class oxidoreductase [Pseudonocardia humida]MCO1656147.1 TIGR03564 family F420-dependent LLM class oxidoreductase [Pseudonocardia humida]